MSLGAEPADRPANFADCPEIDEQFEFVRPLKETILGSISLYRHRSTGNAVVIKTFSMDKEQSQKQLMPGLMEDFRVELALHQRLTKLQTAAKLDCVVPLLATYQSRSGDRIYAVMEACYSDFLGVIAKAQFSPEHARHFFRHMMLALQFFHSNNIYHCDISLENMLLDFNNRLKFCDFGVAITLDQSAIDAALSELVAAESAPTSNDDGKSPQVISTANSVQEFASRSLNLSPSAPSLIAPHPMASNHYFTSRAFDEADQKLGVQCTPALRQFLRFGLPLTKNFRGKLRCVCSFSSFCHSYLQLGVTGTAHPRCTLDSSLVMILGNAMCSRLVCHC